jgi:hypothetical protein
MRLIVNEIFSLEEFDNQRLAKYMRCMFQAILPLDDNLAFQVVEQAVQIAREGSQVSGSHHYTFLIGFVFFFFFFFFWES